MKYLKKDALQIYIADSRKEMGKIAGEDVAALIKLLLQEKDEINIMFAAAPSQNEVLENLVSDKEIDWTKINGFHMDEYIGLRKDAPQGFGNFLKKHIFDLKPFKSIHLIDITAKDPWEEAARYEKVLKAFPMDICILGIGENGHIAFNDPAEANFKDNYLVKPVHLDDICRQQQVNDGCFLNINEVPSYAMSVTIPGLLRAKAMFCVVPTKNKANAVKAMIYGDVVEACPCTVLRTKNCTKLYLDSDSASQL